jgi:uncharacterized protein YneF (UPF0154 family)
MWLHIVLAIVVGVLLGLMLLVYLIHHAFSKVPPMLSDPARTKWLQTRVSTSIKVKSRTKH